MRVPKTLLVLLLVALLAWGIEAISLMWRSAAMPSRIKAQAEGERRALRIQFREKERRLNDEYRAKKYLATGQTVYDRIFNTPEQTLPELIERTALESVPKGWDCEVRVEEFSHFILLIYLPANAPSVEASDVMVYLAPVVRHCGFCLSDVAVFDRTHKSYLFYDSEALKYVARGETPTDILLHKVKQQGELFTRFNSITLECKKYEQHLFLPMEIIGPDGVQTCLALFDSGATTTMLSRDVITRTGSDSLEASPRRTFDTANGRISCPIVYREINVGGLSKTIEVAVNEMDKINLLGMNYFQGLRYIVDGQGSCVYVWEERRVGTPEFSLAPFRKPAKDPRQSAGSGRENRGQ